jgi:hypothetical protein
LLIGCEHCASPGNDVLVDVLVEVEVDVDVTVELVVVELPSQPGSTGSTRSAKSDGPSVAFV